MRNLKSESIALVSELLKEFDAQTVDEISRESIDARHILMVAKFLPDEANDLIIRLLNTADANKDTFVVTEAEVDFFAAGFSDMKLDALKIISRILSTSGREIEITHSEIIVSPNKKIMGKKEGNRKKGSLQYVS